VGDDTKGVVGLDGGPVKSDVSSADIIMVVQSCRAGRIIAMLSKSAA
jgi:hypothetical protein